MQYLYRKRNINFVLKNLTWLTAGMLAHYQVIDLVSHCFVDVGSLKLPPAR